jgi:hypothetical protein
MKKLKFVQLKKDSQEHYDLLESMMIPYNIELDSHHLRKSPVVCLTCKVHQTVILSVAMTMTLS